MSKKYKHFNKDERNELSILLKKDYSLRSIAKTMGRNPSTISREVNKNGGRKNYNSRNADHKFYVKRLNSKFEGMKIVKYPELVKYIRKKIKDWTPEQIAGRWNQEKHQAENGEIVKISTRIVYKYLYSPRGQSLCKYLPSKRHKRRKRKGKKKLKKAFIPNRTSIHKRSRKVDERKSFGHFEGDTMGKIKSDKEVLTGLTERVSRKIFLKKVGRLKYSMDGFKKKLNPHRKILRSVTFDNGLENISHEKLNVQTYFCDPYSSWQKGSVENGFLRVRRFIPKGDSLENYSSQKITAIENVMNNTPRKCLGFLTPNEVFNKLVKLKFNSS